MCLSPEPYEEAPWVRGFRECGVAVVDWGQLWGTPCGSIPLLEVGMEMEVVVKVYVAGGCVGSLGISVRMGMVFASLCWVCLRWSNFCLLLRAAQARKKSRVFAKQRTAPGRSVDRRSGLVASCGPEAPDFLPKEMFDFRP